MLPGKFLQSNELEKAYLGKHIHDLLATLSEQVETVYRRRGIVFPVTASSTLHYISEQNGVSLADIARALEVTHQITTQRVQKLEKIGLVEKRADENDKRRFEWHLTAQGQDQAHRLLKSMQDAALIYVGLYQEIGIDLADAIRGARQAILKNPIPDRFAQFENVEKTG